MAFLSQIFYIKKSTNNKTTFRKLLLSSSKCNAINFERKTRDEEGQSDVGGKIVFSSLPYIGQSSMIIRRIMEDFDPRIKVAFVNQNSLRYNIFFSD